MMAVGQWAHTHACCRPSYPDNISGVPYASRCAADCHCLPPNRDTLKCALRQSAIHATVIIAHMTTYMVTVGLSLLKSQILVTMDACVQRVATVK